jgi:hypothetical protein
VRLIEAYAAYGRAVTAGRAVIPPEGGELLDLPGHTPLTPITGNRQPTTSTWPLCILGGGELKADLIAKCHALGLNVIESAPWESSPTPDSCLLPPESSSPSPDSCLLSPDSASPSHFAPLGTSGRAQRSSPTVFLPGFRQIAELPQFYAHAGCFVHPALEEPWGLVINEAMACGLPILSSSNVGAAEELVDDGVNGWCFDAENVDEMAALMRKISAPDFPLAECGAASTRILEERCPTAAFGTGLGDLLNGWTFDPNRKANIVETLKKLARLSEKERAKLGESSCEILEERCTNTRFGEALAEILE